VNEVSDIDPAMMRKCKVRYTRLLSDYTKAAKGPFKGEAVAEYFKSIIIDGLATMIKDIEQAY
jgi:hypothetical protein